jgi:hypothetical protein
LVIILLKIFFYNNHSHQKHQIMKTFSALLCSILLGFAANTMAQNSVSLPNISSVPGPVTVQVDYDFTTAGVNAFEIQIIYDPAELTYVDYTAGDIPDDAEFNIVGSTAGEINIAWVTFTSRSDAGVLVNLDFVYIGTGGITPLTFAATGYIPGDEDPLEDPSWLADGGDPSLVLPATFNNGSITYIAPVPLSIWAVFLGIALVAAFAVTRFYRIV